MDIQALLCAGLAKYKPNISEIQSCEWVCDLHRSNSANISPMMSDEFCHWPTNLTSLQIASLDFCLGRACFLRICHWLTGWDSYWHRGEKWRLNGFWEIFHFVWKNTSICVRDMKNISDFTQCWGFGNTWAIRIHIGIDAGSCTNDNFPHQDLFRFIKESTLAYSIEDCWCHDNKLARSCQKSSRINWAWRSTTVGPDDHDLGGWLCLWAVNCQVILWYIHLVQGVPKKKDFLNCWTWIGLWVTVWVLKSC